MIFKLQAFQPAGKQASKQAVRKLAGMPQKTLKPLRHILIYLQLSIHMCRS